MSLPPIITYTLLHGTTRQRAEQIVAFGPDPRYQEPGGHARDDGFSMSIETGPFDFGTPEQYARGKAKGFPGEGGAVILKLEVPAEIVQKATSDWFPLSQGLVQFDHGSGLEELIAAWPVVRMSAQIRTLA